MAAVVAGELAGRLVEHQRDVAVGALPDAPAEPAGEEVRPAAAVEQHDRLLSAAADAVELAARALVQRPRHARHGHQLHRRQAAAVHALAQLEPLVAHHALRPRRGAAGQQQRALERGAPLGHHARVVARIALLLVGGVVLLVDHDQAEVVERSEHRRARADADARLAAAHAPPLVVALARGELRVHDRHGVAEALDEAARGLRRERDLGHEHDRRAAALQRRGHRAQVDLGLAAAGHAVQQQRRARPLHARDDRVERRALRRRRLHAAGARSHAVDPRPPRRLGGLLQRHEPAPLEAAQRRVVAPASRATDDALAGPAPGPRARRAGARPAARRRRAPRGPRR